MGSELDTDRISLTYNKLLEALNSVDICTVDATGAFKNLSDILGEMAEKWKNDNNLRMRYISEIIGGKRYSGIIIEASTADLTWQLKTINNMNLVDKEYECIYYDEDEEDENQALVSFLESFVIRNEVNSV